MSHNMDGSYGDSHAQTEMNIRKTFIVVVSSVPQ